jgi:hypothetical protein
VEAAGSFRNICERTYLAEYKVKSQYLVFFWIYLRHFMDPIILLVFTSVESTRGDKRANTERVM